MKLRTERIEEGEYVILIDIHHDEHMGPPWEEHDGHGVVSDWERREADESCEWELSSDHYSRRFYNHVETLAIAKRDGWGLGKEQKAELARKLGQRPTPKQILMEAVRCDFDYLRGWCNDDWSWKGYTTRIETPGGATIDGDSCWGYDDEEYMVEEATGNAVAEIERHKLTLRETAIAECCP